MVFEADFAYSSTTRDYDKPRANNRYVLEPENFQAKLVVQSNKNKNFSYRVQWNKFNYFKEDFNERKSQNRIYISTLYRFSDRFSLELKSNHIDFKDDIGYLDTLNENIYFGRRNIKSVENNIDFSYFFDSKKWVNLKLRNYWSRAKYDNSLFLLSENGKRTQVDYSLLDFNPNTNFNIWNLDISFEWWFAPGSNMILLYRNQLFNSDNSVGLDYLQSLNNLFDFNAQHQLSLRINYLINLNRKKNKL